MSTIAASAASTGAASSVTVAPLAGCLAGDIHEVRLTVHGSTATITATPAGWTGITNTVWATTRRVYVYQRVTGDFASEVNAVFTFSAAAQYSRHNFLVRGTDNNAIYDPSLSIASSGTSDTALVAPSVTPIGGSGLLVVSVHTTLVAAGVTLTTPTGMTLVTSTTGDGTNGISARVFSEDIPNPGATGTRTSTSNTATPWVATASVFTTLLPTSLVGRRRMSGLLAR